MTIKELEQFLSAKKIDFEILKHEKPIKSRFDALNYFKLEEMAPTLILKTEKILIALIISGAREKIDLEIIRQKLAYDQLKLASKDEIIENLGMHPGAIALVGHGLPCIMDELIFQQKYIYGGSGDENCTLKINPRDLQNISNVVCCFE